MVIYLQAKCYHKVMYGKLLVVSFRKRSRTAFKISTVYVGFSAKRWKQKLLQYWDRFTHYHCYIAIQI